MSKPTDCRHDHVVVAKPRTERRPPEHRCASCGAIVVRRWVTLKK